MKPFTQKMIYGLVTDIQAGGMRQKKKKINKNTCRQ